ncbi:recombination protein RecR [Bradymonadaceae bacterium TMQ3]|uniref:Recombination protein RecR n=1 Tax=Lujinxingia sediminis TaxID=2480984 RepID=A0ABY0CVH9_9DELT|nr:recombination mediator RecR [Lujinxingia sediminis]RDV37244.1 recombination protein RecR [Bradymonadaceae bacterium TMQ3]RVU46808.1 recombination protein RecR [Lujinxingia sediminis]TXC74818.1 recombination protein RecR [Bradymonadales bacterium TMQ1]
MKPRDPITRLVNAFRKLPGIGERTATRLAFFVLNESEEMARELAEALVEVKERVGLCQVCCNLTEADVCEICRERRRDTTTICVVERTQDLRAIERTGDFRGLYHVLHGLISPLDGVGPDDIRLRELLTRLQTPPEGMEEPEEVIVACSPSVDGEATALYLQRLLKPLGLKVSRIASGVPIGGELEYTDRVTLSRALSQRREM